MKALLALLLLGAWLAPAPAAASGSMRCGSRLLSEGMLAAEAVAICGEPDFVDVWPSPRGHGYGYGLHDSIEEWIYNRGSSQLLLPAVCRRTRRGETAGAPRRPRC